jgi:hypothetical protein
LLLAGLSIAGQHSWPCRDKNTRWPVTWWFTREQIMWRYFTWANSPPLLHWLPKVNGNYIPNSPRIYHRNLFLVERSLNCVWKLKKTVKKMEVDLFYGYIEFYVRKRLDRTTYNIRILTFLG